MIVFCGYANSDLTVQIPTLPAAGERVQAVALQLGDGGMAANAAVAAARLGADARFAGVLGDDALSAAFLDALRADGVDVSWTSRDGELTTSVVLLTPDGERSIISQDDGLRTGHIAEVVRRTDDGWLYLDGYRFPGAAHVLPGAAHVVVDLDGCETTEAALAALGVAEHVVLGRAQAHALLGNDAALGTLAAREDVHLVVTDGARGWTAYAPSGERHEGPAVAVSVVDATGAGDCFAGAYCTELARGVAAVPAARFAAVAAGLSCARAGARAGLPHRDAVRSHL